MQTKMTLSDTAIQLIAQVMRDRGGLVDLIDEILVDLFVAAETVEETAFVNKIVARYTSESAE
jgi:hypothetical protein